MVVAIIVILHEKLQKDCKIAKQNSKHQVSIDENDFFNASVFIWPQKNIRGIKFKTVHPHCPPILIRTVHLNAIKREMSFLRSFQFLNKNAPSSERSSILYGLSDFMWARIFPFVYGRDSFAIGICFGIYLFLNWGWWCFLCHLYYIISK